MVTIHGGTDEGPAIVHDFSTNANPLGPPPGLWQAVLDADRHRYPDPAYTALRAHLGAIHGVDAARVVPASGGSEAIRRLTLAARLAGITRVFAPQPGYGDYAAAAAALGLAVRGYANVGEVQAPTPSLVWVCEPRNPSGASIGSEVLRQLCERSAGSIVVVDTAYEPLRLIGEPTAIPESCWQLHCPNKALGLTGVRAAYLIAPAETQLDLQTLAPSWVLSAEGEALLRHRHDIESEAWLATSRERLRDWTAQQCAALAALGWRQLANKVVPFWLAKPPQPLDHARLRAAHGIKLRDASSFGLPGWVRIAALPPASQAALIKALEA